MKIEGNEVIYLSEKSTGPNVFKNTILADNSIKLVEVMTTPYHSGQVFSYEIITRGGVVIKTMKETSKGQALLTFKKMTMAEFQR
jgi:hypothetical protein